MLYADTFWLFGQKALCFVYIYEYKFMIRGFVMQQLDFSLFQPLNGSTPFRFVAAHPTEPLVALQAFLETQQILQARTISHQHQRLGTSHLRFHCLLQPGG